MNQTHAAVESTPPLQSGINVRRVRALVLLLVCAGGLWFLIPNSAPPTEITILPPDYSIPAPPLPIPDRWIPMKWSWLWRLRSALLPANPTIDIETMVVRLGNSGKSLLVEALEGRTPYANSNGVHAWILSEQDLLDMFGRRPAQKQRDDSIRIGRMTTGPGVLANLSMTTMVPIDGTPVSVGDSFTQAVLKRGKSVVLTGSFTSWEAVTNTSFSAQKKMISLRTNLTLAANLLIPSGRGVFLLDTNRANIESSGTGLFISVKLR